MGPLFFGLDHFLDSRTEIHQMLHWFFGNLKTLKATFTTALLQLDGLPCVCKAYGSGPEYEGPTEQNVE